MLITEEPDGWLSRYNSQSQFIGDDNNMKRQLFQYLQKFTDFRKLPQDVVAVVFATSLLG